MAVQNLNKGKSKSNCLCRETPELDSPSVLEKNRTFFRTAVNNIILLLSDKITDNLLCCRPHYQLYKMLINLQLLSEVSLCI